MNEYGAGFNAPAVAAGIFGFPTGNFGAGTFWPVTLFFVALVNPAIYFATQPVEVFTPLSLIQIVVFAPPERFR